MRATIGLQQAQGRKLPCIPKSHKYASTLKAMDKYTTQVQFDYYVGKGDMAKLEKKEREKRKNQMIQRMNKIYITIKKRITAMADNSKHYSSQNCMNLTTLPLAAKYALFFHDDTFIKKSEEVASDDGGADYWVCGF